VKRLGLENDVDMDKLEKAVTAKTGVPTYVMEGAEPGASGEEASNSRL
jgi:hypothetical protein